MYLEIPIYCINLSERADRKEHVIKEFKKLDIDFSKVIFPVFSRDPRGGKYGCYDSHVKIWKDFYENHTANHCLIFEDDFVTNDNCNDIINKGDEFIRNNNKEVDFLFLNNLYSELPSTLNSNYFSRGISTDTHAYFISRNYIKTLINNYSYHWLNADGLPIDISINFNRKHMLYSNKCYYTRKESFTQIFILNSHSDISTNFYDLICRIPFIKWMHSFHMRFNLAISNEDDFKDQYIKWLTNENNKNNPI